MLRSSRHYTFALGILCTSALFWSACVAPPPLVIEEDDCTGPNCDNNPNPNNGPNNGANNGANNGPNNGPNNAPNNAPNNNPNPNNNPVGPVNECTAESSKCVDNSSIQRCERNEAGTTWAPAETCPSGLCVDGLCCPGGCNQGETRCTEAGIQTCTTLNTGCLGFSAPVACPQGESCNESGQCVSTCTNDCVNGEKQCYPEGSPAFRLCVQTSSGCFKWSSTEVQCQSNSICQNDTCVVQCQHECTVAQLGRTRCEANREKICQANANGCRRWAEKGTSCIIQGQAPCNSATLQREVTHGTCVQVNYNWANCAADCGWGLCSDGLWYCQRDGLSSCTTQIPHNACGP